MTLIKTKSGNLCSVEFHERNEFLAISLGWIHPPSPEDIQCAEDIFNTILDMPSTASMVFDNKQNANKALEKYLETGKYPVQ
jgi:hypothetical protein